MAFFYRTPNAFFVSAAGRRLQKQIGRFLRGEKLIDRSAVLIGSVFPFLDVFEQNNPDIVFETETFDSSVFFSSLPSAFGIDAFFIAALNESVAGNLPLLIKEAGRLLKPQGRLFLLVKNKKRLFFARVPEMPETPLRILRTEIRGNGFSLQREKGLLHFPCDGSVGKKVDDFLFSLPLKNGNFSLIVAQKEATEASAVEHYKSTRITKASVFTSPRT